MWRLLWESCCGFSGRLNVRLVPWWLSGEMGRKDSRKSLEGAAAVGLRHKWQSSAVDSARRGPPSKKVVGESSMQPVGVLEEC